MDETLSEIGRVFRSVGKMVRERTEDYFGNVTPVDRALREVNDEDTCTIPNSLLRELAKASNEIHSYHPIMQCIWQGLAQEGAAWRRTYKSLCLLEYVILFGPRRALEDCRHALMRIKYLCGFRYHDGTREQGGGVRQKSHYIIELIEQPETLAAARQKAMEDSDRYVGIENKPIFDVQGMRFGSLSPPDSVLPTAAPQTWSPFFSGPPPAFGPPNNPFATINAFQSESEARRTWNLNSSPDQQTNFSRGYDAPVPTRAESLQGSTSQQSTSNSASASFERGTTPANWNSQPAGKINKSTAVTKTVNLLNVDDDAVSTARPNDIDDDFFKAQTDIFSQSSILPREVSTAKQAESSDLLSFDDDRQTGDMNANRDPNGRKPATALDDLVGL
eukprot:Gregarina_sp_Poly_1__8224@NODE_478_length_8064_cov_159_533200_g387_i0_p2_GENE_NODE_478_length_8064_cov_159_533200_g387_i0NODE_478_length_8064_cov_159_533200_g387_i0_p2_ORF_typecomplete_len390_score56_18ENTH/PF01417_20/1_5e22_NODE_478_length_8064_cov_159_533200_g387_i07121881